MIRGLPDFQSDAKILSAAKNIHIRNHLDAGQMNQAILQSSLIISRSGYTTIMDLVKLKKKAILIPTPGQGEQEYLAKYLLEMKMFYSQKQEGFSLAKALIESAKFPYLIPVFKMEAYKAVVNEFVRKLKNN